MGSGINIPDLHHCFPPEKSSESLPVQLYSELRFDFAVGHHAKLSMKTNHAAVLSTAIAHKQI
jgi:hypothetical protein